MVVVESRTVRSRNTFDATSLPIQRASATRRVNLAAGTARSRDQSVESQALQFRSRGQCTAPPTRTYVATSLRNGCVPVAPETTRNTRAMTAMGATVAVALVAALAITLTPRQTTTTTAISATTMPSASALRDGGNTTFATAEPFGRLCFQAQRQFRVPLQTCRQQRSDRLRQREH